MGPGASLGSIGGVDVVDRPLARAYAACEALARSHYENFPVASRLLPRPMRPHVAAVYAFARVADDIADEGAAPAADRRTALDAWQRRLHDAVAAEPPAECRDNDDRGDLILAAVAHSIRTLDLPLRLFDDLVSAFGQDTMTNRYASWADVLDYCRRSANPVGRLVLRIGGYREAGARSIVGRALHGAAADELLAGLRPRLARRPALRPARRQMAAGADEGRARAPAPSARRGGARSNDA